MLLKLLNFIFGTGPARPSIELDIAFDISAFYRKHVAFYRQLKPDEQLQFEKRALAFLQTTEITGHKIEVKNEDRLLVAASAIIPVWKFTGWHYLNLRQVTLLAGTFNSDYEIRQPDSLIAGMVGSGDLSGKMFLSRPSLYQGFANSQDKKNVGIHEFVHLIDMADGHCDGLPKLLSEQEHAIPWLEMVRLKISEIENDENNINAYGATNKQEFFAVASEYFFERPKLLEQKHPALYTALSHFYQQDLAAIEADIQPRRKAPCPCGSGKKYKNCCEPED